MKKIIILIYLLIGTNCFSQDFEDCLDSLYSQNFLTKLFAVECINDLKNYEALDDLANLLESQPPYLQIEFLNALYTLEDPQITTKAHELISRADGFNEDPEHPYDPLEAKVFATAILVYSGDFSTIDYAFEQLNQNDITTDDALALHLLPYIMDNAPSRRVEAKDILLNELNNEDVDIRYYALTYLAEEFSEEMNSELVNKFVVDDDLPTKIKALEHLCINNYSNLNSLLKEQLELEEEPSLRIDVADTLLQKFGEPSDLKAVMDFQPNEPDETARSLMAFSINEFNPPRPIKVELGIMIENLISYTNELIQYEWLSIEGSPYDYLGALTSLHDVIASEDINEAYRIINEDLLPQIESGYENEFMTIEGYKFLYYHTIFIRDVIEQKF